MKPLTFLLVRTTFNGIRRALTSPQRLIGLIFLLAYWFRILIPGFQPRRGGMSRMVVAEMPPLSHIDAFVFTGFAALTLPLMLSVMTPKGAFKGADVDVLFPTPLNPKVVLTFRMIRDAALTLLLPLFVAIFARPAVTPFSSFVRNFPEQGQIVMKVVTVAWLLLALGWTSLGHGLTMTVNRSDERSDTNKRIIEWAVGLLLVAILAVIGLRLRSEISFQAFLDIAHNPFLRVVFWPATLGSGAVIHALDGNHVLMVVDLVGIALLTVLGYGLAMSQISYMYDQAAARGFGSVQTRQMQRSGNVYGVAAHQAKEGKRIGFAWFSRWASGLTFRGPLALLWKDLLLQSRGMLLVYFLMVPMTVLITVLPALGASKSFDGGSARVVMPLFLCCGVFMTTMNLAMGGSAELLQRVDFQKPLPFSTTITLFWEVVPKAIPTVVGSFLGGLIATVLYPQVWDIAVGGLLMAPSMAMVLSAVTLLVTILFPDLTDTTQASFRGLMIMLGSVICAAPMLLLGSVMLMAKINGVLIGLPILAINVGITIGVCAVAGALYAGFNPSE